MKSTAERLVIEGSSFASLEAFLMVLDGWMGVPPSSSGEVTIRCDREGQCGARLVIDAEPGESLDALVSATAGLFDVLRPGGLEAVDVAPDAAYWRDAARRLERLARARGSLKLEAEGTCLDLPRQLAGVIASATCSTGTRRRLLAAVRRLASPTRGDA